MRVLLLLFVSCLLVACQSESNNDPNLPAAAAVEGKKLGEQLATYLRPYPDEITPLYKTVRDREDTTPAMEAYLAGDYAKADTLFPNHASSHEMGGYVHLYQGISKLMIGQDNDAFNTFLRIRSTAGKPFEISQWYVALNYVSFGNVYEARRKLDAIIEADTYPGAAQARKLLNDLPEK